MDKILIGFICALLIFSGGVFVGYKFLEPKQIIKEVEVIKNVDKIIYRDYLSVDCCEIAKGYDKTPFNQTFTVKELKSDYTLLVLKWDLYERNGEQEIKVPVYQAGNWKFYAGIGLGAVAVGGLTYMLLK